LLGHGFENAKNLDPLTSDDLGAVEVDFLLGGWKSLYLKVEKVTICLFVEPDLIVVGVICL